MHVTLYGMVSMHVTLWHGPTHVTLYHGTSHYCMILIYTHHAHYGMVPDNGILPMHVTL